MSQAILNWTPAGGASSVSQSVQYSSDNKSTWTTFSTLSPSASTETVTGLNDNQIYEFRVVNNCSVGGPTGSNETETIKITCPTLTLGQTYNSVSVSFANLGNSITSYDIQLLNSSDSLLTSTTVSSPFSSTITYNFTGLTASTVYHVKVISHAGTYQKTDCGISSITTSAPPSCLAPTNVTATMS